jgi:hypothetical protein
MVVARRRPIGNSRTVKRLRIRQVVARRTGQCRRGTSRSSASRCGRNSPTSCCFSAVPMSAAATRNLTWSSELGLGYRFKPWIGIAGDYRLSDRRGARRRGGLEVQRDALRAVRRLRPASTGRTCRRAVIVIPAARSIHEVNDRVAPFGDATVHRPGAANAARARAFRAA